uniref:Uncharacterized protein n=1 Tax=Rhinolophus ferrumequinum TaxID=59479 RepID=A0A671EQF1_RHIFE
MSGLRLCLIEDFLLRFGVLPSHQLQGRRGAATVFLWDPQACRPSGVSHHCGLSLSLCMFRGEPFFFFFFFFFLFYSSQDVDAAEMCGYRSARVPEVCIEFRSQII